MSVLEADSVGKSFGSARVLSSASFRAEAGEVTALLGRNGAGKSTLLKIAAGWLAPDHGFIRFRGETYFRPRLPRLAARGLFFLPADWSLLSPALTLGEYLRVIARLPGAGEVEEVTELLRLGDLLDRSPPSLSGGERRRAEVGCALLRRPACLLADEPFYGIAPLDAELLVSAFRTMAERGCALVLTGHEVSTVLLAADRVVWVTAGTAYDLGPPEEARREWRFRREYLGLTPAPRAR